MEPKLFRTFALNFVFYLLQSENFLQNVQFNLLEHSNSKVQFLK